MTSSYYANRDKEENMNEKIYEVVKQHYFDVNGKMNGVDQLTDKLIECFKELVKENKKFDTLSQKVDRLDKLTDEVWNLSNKIINELEPCIEMDLNSSVSHHLQELHKLRNGIACVSFVKLRNLADEIDELKEEAKNKELANHFWAE